MTTSDLMDGPTFCFGFFTRFRPARPRVIANIFNELGRAALQQKRASVLRIFSRALSGSFRRPSKMTGFSFSEYLVSRYREYRNKVKKKDLSSNLVLKNEYSEFILDILKGDGAGLLDEEVRKMQSPDITQIDYLVKLVNVAFLLTQEKGKNFSWLMKYRTTNRIQALRLTHLTSIELDFISAFSRYISRPCLGLSHRDSLDFCLDQARKFVSGSQACIPEGSITYETLKEQVRRIAESDFSSTLCPSPTQREDYLLHDYFHMNLKEWLARNPEKILDTVHCGNGKNMVKEYRLSLEVMTITRGILTCLKNLHDKLYFYDCELVSLNILISDTYEVKLRDVNLKREGSVSSDFTKLKEVIEEIVCSAPSSSGVQYPEDVSHFMNLLSTSPLDGHRQDMLYNHSCIWTPYDVVKNVCMFRMVCNYNSSLSQDINVALRKMPEDTIDDWRSKIPPQSRYEEFESTKWRYNGSAELGLLTFMRDAYPHAYGKNFGRQGSIATERELFAMFPSFMAHFVDVTSHLPEFTEIYANSGCDYIKVPPGEDMEPRSTQSARSAQEQPQPQLQLAVPRPQQHVPTGTVVQMQPRVQYIPQFQAQSGGHHQIMGGYTWQHMGQPQMLAPQQQQYQQQAPMLATWQHMGQPQMLAPQQQQYNQYGYLQQAPMYPQPTYEQYQQYLQYLQYRPR